TGAPRSGKRADCASGRWSKSLRINNIGVTDWRGAGYAVVLTRPTRAPILAPRSPHRGGGRADAPGPRRIQRESSETYPKGARGGAMSETRAVELRVRLPRAVAAEVEGVQRSDPEVLSRILMYGVTRRAIFEHLRSQEDPGRDRP